MLKSAPFIFTQDKNQDVFSSRCDIHLKNGPSLNLDTVTGNTIKDGMYYAQTVMNKTLCKAL